MKNFKLDNVLKNSTILYIEDDANIRTHLSNTLQLLFKSVHAFETAEDGLHFIHNNHIDIILSDINLTDMNGVDFIKKVRETYKDIPVILLTAYTDESILLEAARLKLINYLIKPVVFEELYNSLLEAANDILRFGNYQVEFENNIIFDIQSGTLLENGENRSLTNSEYKLINLFIHNQNRTLSVSEIKKEIWDDEYYATDTALKSLLNKLRSKIGKNSIKNISGIGYKIFFRSNL